MTPEEALRDSMGLGGEGIRADHIFEVWGLKEARSTIERLRSLGYELRPIEAEAAALDVERMARALETIREHYGQVCEQYATCYHESCRGSYGAWATADKALGEQAHAALARGEIEDREVMG